MLLVLIEEYGNKTPHPRLWLLSSPASDGENWVWKFWWHYLRQVHVHSCGSFDDNWRENLMIFEERMITILGLSWDYLGTILGLSGDYLRTILSQYADWVLSVPMFHWSIGPLVHWTIEPLLHWSIGPLVHWSIGWMSNVKCQKSIRSNVKCQKSIRSNVKCQKS